jgi:hypothetical protein
MLWPETGRFGRGFYWKLRSTTECNAGGGGGGGEGRRRGKIKNKDKKKKCITSVFRRYLHRILRDTRGLPDTSGLIAG